MTQIASNTHYTFFFVLPVVNFAVCAINGEAFVYGENPATAEFRG